ncbi:MAG: tetratricopeptide repeat protein [Acidobacteriota bacterium]|nr:tetratricopeptide repeat protein [Acidobacteriota bacterium]
MQKSMFRLKTFVAFLFFSMLVFGSTTLSAQQPLPKMMLQTDDYIARREAAIVLVNEKKYAEALPLLEKLAAEKQADGQVFLGLGLAHWNLQNATKNKVEWKQTRLKARDAFLKASELGASVPEIDLLTASIKADGGDRNDSDNPQAQAALEEAFPLFAARDYKKAVVAYERAATLDPTHYEAALYTGNTYYALKDYDKAGIWFAKAIAIDANRETAHRYWGDGLMLSGKNKEAQDKFFDAIIAEPYNNAAWRGLGQFAGRNNIKLAHPKIEIPVNISSSENGNTKLTLGMGDKDEDDGSIVWTAYGLNRAAWQTGKDGKRSDSFSKAYPNEKVYRHSLTEETAALRTALTVLKESKTVKNLNPSVAALKKLNDEGLLEAYVLFARADAGIRRDYAAYRQSNRDKLKRYLTEYVIKNGGS